MVGGVVGMKHALFLFLLVLFGVMAPVCVSQEEQLCGNGVCDPGEEIRCPTDCVGEVCTPNWSCSAWSECIDGLQNRTCVDLNNCGTPVGKPVETRACEEMTQSTPEPLGPESYEEVERTGTPNHTNLLLISIAAILSFSIVFIYIFKKSGRESNIVEKYPPEAMERLRNYVQENLNKGYSAEQLKNSLISAGWDERVVDEILREVMRRESIH